MPNPASTFSASTNLPPLQPASFGGSTPEEGATTLKQLGMPSLFQDEENYDIKNKTHWSLLKEIEPSKFHYLLCLLYKLLHSNYVT